MNLNLGGESYGGQGMDSCNKTAHAISAYKPRTLREQLTDQIAGYNAKIANLQEALDSLTPDVEKALNALGKL